MEVPHNRRLKKTGRAQLDVVIVEFWQELGQPVVDAQVLNTIRSRVVERFDDHEVHGPAAIARLLADEGADLKHPEVIESDAQWRQARIEITERELGFDQLASPEMMTLLTAEKFIGQLEELRKQYELNQDPEALTEVRGFASVSRRLAESIARNPLGEQAARAEQAEIAEWLKVWLQTPGLFPEWLQLRRRSGEFRARFPLLNDEDTKTQSK